MDDLKEKRLALAKAQAELDRAEEVGDAKSIKTARKAHRKAEAAFYDAASDQLIEGKR